MPEKSNYKVNSKNYIKKNIFNKEMKIEDIDQNKVNTILEDIENAKINTNNCINDDINMNKFDVYNNFLDNNILNINQFPNANISAFDFNNNYCLSQINTINFNFESKYIYFYLIFCS